MSPLRAVLDDYLKVRRSLGFKLEPDARLLDGFVTYVEQAGSERVTTELALVWAKLPDRASPYRWSERLGTVRSFARYLATIDPTSEVPSKDLLRRPVGGRRPSNSLTLVSTSSVMAAALASMASR